MRQPNNNTPRTNNNKTQPHSHSLRLSLDDANRGQEEREVKTEVAATQAPVLPATVTPAHQQEPAPSKVSANQPERLTAATIDRLWAKASQHIKQQIQSGKNTRDHQSQGFDFKKLIRMFNDQWQTKGRHPGNHVYFQLHARLADLYFKQSNIDEKRLSDNDWGNANTLLTIAVRHIKKLRLRDTKYYQSSQLTLAKIIVGCGEQKRPYVYIPGPGGACQNAITIFNTAPPNALNAEIANYITRARLIIFGRVYHLSLTAKRWRIETGSLDNQSRMVDKLKARYPSPENPGIHYYLRAKSVLGIMYTHAQKCKQAIQHLHTTVTYYRSLNLTHTNDYHLAAAHLGLCLLIEKIAPEPEEYLKDIPGSSPYYQAAQTLLAVSGKLMNRRWASWLPLKSSLSTLESRLHYTTQIALTQGRQQHLSSLIWLAQLQCHAERRHLHAARDTLNKALQLSSSNTQPLMPYRLVAKYLLGYTKHQLGLFDEAQLVLKTIPTPTQNDTFNCVMNYQMAQAYLGDIYLRTGKYSEAISGLELVSQYHKRSSTTSHRNYPFAQSRLGEAYHQSGDLLNAKASFQSLIKLFKQRLKDNQIKDMDMFFYPDYRFACSRLAMVLFKMGSLNEAVEMLSSVVSSYHRLDIKRDHLYYHSGLRIGYMTKEKERAVTTPYSQPTEEGWRRYFVKTADELNKKSALLGFPQSADYLMQSEYFFAQEKAGAYWFEHGMQSSPHSRFDHFTKAIAHLKKITSTQISDTQHYLRHHYHRALLILGEIYFQMHNFTEAEICLNKLSNAVSSLAYTHATLHAIHWERKENTMEGSPEYKKIEKMITNHFVAMRKALTAQKKLPGTDHTQRLLNNSMHLHCSMCYLRQKKFQHAEDQLKNIETTPRITDYYKAHYVYAQLKAEQNLWEAGFSYLQKIPRTHPMFISHVEPLYNYYKEQARSARMNKSKHNSASTSSPSIRFLNNQEHCNNKRHLNTPTNSNKRPRLWL